MSTSGPTGTVSTGCNASSTINYGGSVGFLQQVQPNSGQWINNDGNWYLDNGSSGSSWTISTGTFNAGDVMKVTKSLYEIFVVDKYSAGVDGPFYVVASNSESAKFESGVYDLIKSADYTLDDVNILVTSKGAVELHED